MSDDDMILRKNAYFHKMHTWFYAQLAKIFLTVSNKEFGPNICCLINTNMVWSQKGLFYRSNFRVIHIELFVMTSGIFGFGKERVVVPFPKFAFDL